MRNSFSVTKFLSRLLDFGAFVVAEGRWRGRKIQQQHLRLVVVHFVNELVQPFFCGHVESVLPHQRPQRRRRRPHLLRRRAARNITVSKRRIDRDREHILREERTQRRIARKW